MERWLCEALVEHAIVTALKNACVMQRSVNQHVNRAALVRFVTMRLTEGTQHSCPLSSLPSYVPSVRQPSRSRPFRQMQLLTMIDLVREHRVELFISACLPIFDDLFPGLAPVAALGPNSASLWPNVDWRASITEGSCDAQSIMARGLRLRAGLVRQGMLGMLLDSDAQRRMKTVTAVNESSATRSARGETNSVTDREFIQTVEQEATCAAFQLVERVGQLEQHDCVRVRGQPLRPLLGEGRRSDAHECSAAQGPRKRPRRNLSAEEDSIVEIGGIPHDAVMRAVDAARRLGWLVEKEKGEGKSNCKGKSQAKGKGKNKNKARECGTAEEEPRGESGRAVSDAHASASASATVRSSCVARAELRPLLVQLNNNAKESILRRRKRKGDNSGATMQTVSAFRVHAREYPLEQFCCDFVAWVREVVPECCGKSAMLDAIMLLQRNRRGMIAQQT